ncbi:MAG: hypothetical protein RLZZ77_904 [Bacteroidota bacterium]
MVIGSAFMGPWAMGALFFVFALVGLHEFYNLLQLVKIRPRLYGFGLVGGAYIFITSMMIALDKCSAQWLLLLLPYLSVVFCLELVKPIHGAFEALSKMILGWMYVIVPFSLIMALATVTGSFDYQAPLGFFVILWINDSSAYFTGRAFGKNKLYPAISPNKTWEGLIGGMLFSLVAGAVISHWFDSLSLVQWIIVAAIIAVLANVGDLFESHLKRIAGVKDSGNLIPGHGGSLDRFDGLLIALPVVYVYLHFIFFL